MSCSPLFGGKNKGRLKEADVSYLSFYLLFLVRGSFKPLIQDLINKQTESNIRATVFSIENFIKKFFYILIGPIIGFSLDQYSIAAAFLCSGLIYLFLSIPVIYQLSKI